MNQDTIYRCHDCGVEFDLIGEGTYMAAMDDDDAECHPFIQMVARCGRCSALKEKRDDIPAT